MRSDHQKAGRGEQAFLCSSSIRNQGNHNTRKWRTQVPTTALATLSEALGSGVVGDPYAPVAALRAFGNVRKTGIEQEVMTSFTGLSGGNATDE